ncbi:Alpha/Beta hydrolase protein [Trametes meyenii]|nr:Alpha/Beta hydrolase protein [Trametes meyenii]
MTRDYLTCPDPDLASKLSKLPPAPATYTEDIEAARVRFDTIFTEIYRSVQRENLPSESAYKTVDHKVSVEGGEIAIRVYTPVSPDEATFPVLVWTHGGGFVFGDLNMDDYYLRMITVDLQLAIVSVEYRLAPEHPFPTSLNDAYAALKWTALNGSSFKGDLSKGFLIGGQSAGGNFPATMAHRAKADTFFSQYPITGQVLQIPLLLHPDAIPKEYQGKLKSYIDNEHAPILNTGHVRDYYEKLNGPPTDPEVSPFLHPSFSGLPPAYMQVCGLDPCRDEQIFYSEKLQAAGTSVKVDIYPGAPHGFQLSFPTTQLAKQYDQEFRAGIRWLLSRPAQAWCVVPQSPVVRLFKSLCCC